jgi:hypothetical protein
LAFKKTPYVLPKIGENRQKLWSTFSNGALWPVKNCPLLAQQTFVLK